MNIERERANGSRDIEPAVLASMRRLTAGFRELRSRRSRKDPSVNAFERELLERERGLHAVLDHLGINKRSGGSSGSAAVERRSVACDSLLLNRNSVAPVTSTDLPHLEGYAAVFDQVFRAKDFDETISKGAFTDTLKSGESFIATFNHNTDQLLGRTPLTLSFTEDKRGLWLRLSPPNTQLGQSVVEMVSRRDILGQSFTFGIALDKWEMRSGRPFRTIEEVILYEAGPVVSPAYIGTSISVVEGSRSKNLSPTSRGVPIAPSKPQYDNRAEWAKLAKIENGILRARIREAEIQSGLPAKQNARPGAWRLDSAKRRLRLFEIEAGCR